MLLYILCSRFQKIDNKKCHRANTDGGICHVKGRPVVATDKKIEKVNNRSDSYAVDEITDGATGDETKGPRVDAADRCKLPRRRR
jgi:hypothetical protein